MYLSELLSTPTEGVSRPLKFLIDLVRPNCTRKDRNGIRKCTPAANAVIIVRG